jgi:lipoprotein-anchoring transpeptidase ErfK/SrfK
MNDFTRGRSRRDFLKLSGLSLLGLLVPGRPLSFFSDPLLSDHQAASAHLAGVTSLQGRITTGYLWSYDSPSNKGKRVKMYWRDLVVNIIGTAIDDDTEVYNRVWYEIDEGGFLYSGWVQPVYTRLNEPYVGAVPIGGLLGEISVPYTDAYAQADVNSKFKYRLYYETTHWVLESTTGADGSVWYRLLDDKYKEFYYIPAKHLRLIDAAEIAPISPNVPGKDKRIEVHLDQQLVLAYEGTRPVFAARAATGGIYRVGTYTTPFGTFGTFHKRPSRHMAAGDLTASGFDLPGVPWVLYITDSGISLHGTYWHNDFGHPRSHGCINLSPTASKWLFRWTMPSFDSKNQFAFDRSVGTTVNIVK